MKVKSFAEKHQLELKKDEGKHADQYRRWMR